MDHPQTQFIVKAVIHKIDILCVHMYGCRVIQKILNTFHFKNTKFIVDHIVT